MAFYTVPAQDKETFNIYNDKIDAREQITEAVKVAQKEGKNIILQIGGNWCSWCRKFYSFTTRNSEVDSVMKENFIILHINYSKENRNLQVMEQLQFPQRFGFPVFVILDQKGERIHTQNSAHLEEGDGYSKEKIVEFLQQWGPEALNPEHYREE